MIVRLNKYLTMEELHLCLENDLSLIAPLVQRLHEMMSRQGFANDVGRRRIGLALHEALTNAITHGNLEVDSELKQTDEQEFFDRSERRCRESPYQERRVNLLAKITPTEAVFVIRDEGPGFDPSQVPDPREPANLDHIGGRGLLLIRSVMDETHYNGLGNQLTMIKRHPSPE